MPSPLPFIPFPAATAGVRNDIAQSSIGPGNLWKAENWVMRDGVFQTRRGLATIGSTQTSRIQGMYAHRTADGDRTIVYATQLNLYAYVGDGNADLDLQAPLTGGDRDLAIFRTFIKSTTNYLLMTNGKDVLQKWDGDQSTHNAADAAGSPPVMRSMMIINNRLLALGLIGDHPNAVDCSAILDFEAGWGDNRVLLADSPGAIVGGLEMGNLQGAIYMDDAIYIVQALGGTEPFAYRLQWLQPDAGPVSSQAMIALPSGEHVFFSKDGNVYIFDGTNVNPVGPHIQKLMIETCDFNYAPLVCMAFDAEQRDLWISYPEKGQTENNLMIGVKLPDGSLWPQRTRSMVGAIAGSAFTAICKAVIPETQTIGDLVGSIGDLPGTIADFSTLRSELVVGRTVADVIGNAHTYGAGYWTGTTVTSSTTSKYNDGIFNVVAFHVAHAALGVIHFDFGGAGAPHFRGLELYGPDMDGNLPGMAIEVQYSDDNSTWLDAILADTSIAGTVNGAHTAAVLTWADFGSHRYWRALITPNYVAGSDFYEIRFLESLTQAALASMTEQTDAPAYFETALLPPTPQYDPMQAPPQGLNFGSVGQVEHFIDATVGRSFAATVGVSKYGFERELGNFDTVTIAQDAPSLSEHDEQGRYFSLRIDTPASDEAPATTIWRGSAMHFQDLGPD